MRHTLQFEVRGDTAEAIQSAAEEITLQFFGPDADIRPGNVYINTTADYEAMTWVGKVTVDVREAAPKPTRKHLSAGATFEVHGRTLLDLVGSADAQLTELYGDEEFTYNLTITQDGMVWTGAVSSWLGSNDMGDF